MARYQQVVNTQLVINRAIEYTAQESVTQVKTLQIIWRVQAKLGILAYGQLLNVPGLAAVVVYAN